MFYLFISHLIFRLNYPDLLLVWGSLCLFVLLPCGLCPVVNISLDVWTYTSHTFCQLAERLLQ